MSSAGEKRVSTTSGRAASHTEEKRKQAPTLQGSLRLPRLLTAWHGRMWQIDSTFTNIHHASSRKSRACSMGRVPSCVGPTCSSRLPPFARVSMSTSAISVPDLKCSFVGLNCPCVPMVKHASHGPGIGASGSFYLAQMAHELLSAMNWPGYQSHGNGCVLFNLSNARAEVYARVSRERGPAARPQSCPVGIRLPDRHEQTFEVRLQREGLGQAVVEELCASIGQWSYILRPLRSICSCQALLSDMLILAV